MSLVCLYCGHEMKMWERGRPRSWRSTQPAHRFYGICKNCHARSPLGKSIEEAEALASGKKEVL